MTTAATKPTCLVLIGLPASGKSTFALDLQRKRVGPGETKWLRLNRDEFRHTLWGNRLPGGAKREDLLTSAHLCTLGHALGAGFNVVVDQTSLDPEVCRRLRAVAEAEGAVYEEKSFLDVPVDVCIERDRRREHRVGADVILGMVRKWGSPPSPVRQFVMSNPEWRDPVIDETAAGSQPVAYDPDLPWAIWVDLDGTLAIHNGRSPYDWTRVGEDALNEPVACVVRDRHAAGDRVIIMSGREDAAKASSLLWLKRNNIPYDEVYMRATGDRRGDDLIKVELFNQHIRGRYNIRFCLDDRDRVVRAARHVLGLPVLQVAEGDF